MKKSKNERIEEAVDTGVTLDESFFEEPKEEKQEKENEYLEMAQRIQAEFDNYRRRNLNIAANSKQEGIIEAVQTLLPIIDTIASARRQLIDESLKASIDLIYKQTLDCFEKLGVKKINALGEPFDPHFHNAIMTEQKEGVEPDIVIDEFQEGFTLGDKVIRHSVVKVSC